MMRAPCGARLRAWSFASGTDLDAPHRTGRAYRFSPMRSAQRVLLATGERLGLLTDGEELRLLLCDPAYPDSHIAMPLAGGTGWRAQNFAPDSYRLLLALAAPKGIAALAGRTGGSSTKPEQDHKGSARAGAQRNRRLPAGGARQSRQRHRTRLAPARGRAMGRGVGLRLSPAVHPETGKPRPIRRARSASPPPACGAAPCRRTARWGRWCVECWIMVTTPGGCWKTEFAWCSACFVTGCRAASCR